MSKTIFKADSGKGGFIRTSLAPVNDRKEARFGPWDIFELIALVLGVILIMRYLLR